MVATDVIEAATVTARFRNIAERHGKVDLAFQVIVPESMRDSKWQLRFYPDMFILGDSIRLDPVVITGEAYRKASSGDTSSMTVSFQGSSTTPPSSSISGLWKSSSRETFLRSMHSRPIQPG